MTPFSDLVAGFIKKLKAMKEVDGTSLLDNSLVAYGTLTGLTTDGFGNLEITVTRSNHATMAGLTLTAVPEQPSSYALRAGCFGLL
ncbi:hypothetical protein SH580_21530 [Coraliomargarita algicola]|uniref:Uncharacterized protein n=1 Tax=Coraliomargarita algicola TaxID=3092156 RepID=A0ABZ0RKP8_9BACT|nr:hypothetical protein [Coraliomargarita sp. J2-16]WPJ96001.1 hypothetical protein SH580_21530 [Coraliomargarita sp. J2-16]